MCKYVIAIILFAVIIPVKVSVSNSSVVGGRSAGMGNASVCLSDFWASHNNQAGLAEYKNTAAGFYYENRFLIKELSLKSGAFVLPTESGVFGLNVSYFGYEQYNESKLGLAYAKSLSDKLSVGIQLDYFSTHIGENYGNKNTVTFEAGLQSKLTDDLYIGVHLFNPIHAKIADYNDERMPTVIRLGLLYKFSDKVLATIETEKDIDYHPVFKAGLEYHITKEIYLRTGISTNPVINTFGFGIELKKLKFDFSSSIHQVLGYSPQFSLIYNVD